MPTTAPSTTHTEEPQAVARPDPQEVLTTDERDTDFSARTSTAVEPVPAARPGPAPVRAPAAARGRVPAIFYGSLLDFSSTRPRRATRDFATSIFIHVTVIGILVLAPFLYTEAIDLTQFNAMRLIAPPPPPPPPAQMTARARALPKRVLSAGGKLVAPAVIPESVAMVHEKPLAPEMDNTGVGVAGGVPGGIPGGQAGGVLGSILSGLQKTPPAPVAVARTEPVRVGGRVKPPRKLFAPPPEYPVLARQARIEGTVVIDSVIDVNGNVVEAKVVSGHPLLMQAALDALRQWKFEPTYLDEQPVPVRLLVTFEFQLGK